MYIQGKTGIDRSVKIFWPSKIQLLYTVCTAMTKHNNDSTYTVGTYSLGNLLYEYDIRRHVFPTPPSPTTTSFTFRGRAICLRVCDLLLCTVIQLMAASIGISDPLISDVLIFAVVDIVLWVRWRVDVDASVYSEIRVCQCQIAYLSVHLLWMLAVKSSKHIRGLLYLLLGFKNNQPIISSVIIRAMNL